MFESGITLHAESLSISIVYHNLLQTKTRQFFQGKYTIFKNRNEQSQHEFANG